MNSKRSLKFFFLLLNLIYELCGSISLPFVVLVIFKSDFFSVFSKLDYSFALWGLLLSSAWCSTNRGFSFLCFRFLTKKAELKLSFVFFIFYFWKTVSFDINCCWKLIYAVNTNHSKHHSISQCYLNCFLLSSSSIEMPILFPRGMDFNHK